MFYNKPICHIAIIGTGLIGASWAALYLARGFDVIATNLSSNTESQYVKVLMRCEMSSL